MSNVERMRPMLGTFVTIRASGSPECDASQTEAAVQSAFRAIERVERLMSFYRRNSDIGRLNRARKGRRFRVHAWTFDVLRLAERLHAASGGIFDCDVGGALMRDGLLPKKYASVRRNCNHQSAIKLLAHGMVRLNRSVTLDLGGIAKGYAVDRAIDVLRAYGASNGSVNAGGDLRVFGAADEPVWIRDPAYPGRVRLLGSLSNGAIATSASYFVPTARNASRGAGAIVDTRLGCRVPSTLSVSVIAKCCLHADALTKIAVLTRGRLPRHIARGSRARVYQL